MPAWPRQNRGSSGCFEAVAACATIRPTSGYSGYEMPSVAAVRWRQFFVPVLRGLYRKGVVLRPSTATGKTYPDVSRAYYEAVHSVLTGDKTAAKAAAGLQVQLVQITGLKPSVTPARAPYHRGTDRPVRRDPGPAKAWASLKDRS